MGSKSKPITGECKTDCKGYGKPCKVRFLAFCSEMKSYEKGKRRRNKKK